MSTCAQSGNPTEAELRYGALVICISQSCATQGYRGTSLIRNTSLLEPYSGTIPRVLGWSLGGGAVSHERGTPVSHDAWLSNRHFPDVLRASQVRLCQWLPEIAPSAASSRFQAIAHVPIRNDSTGNGFKDKSFAAIKFTT